MKLGNLFKFIIAISIAQAAGILGSFFTISSVSTWYVELIKPAFNPPNWVFGPVWTTLYFLIGVSLYLVWKNNWQTVHLVFETGMKAWNPISERLWRGDLQKVNAITVFGVQYVLNILWSWVFFGLQSPATAFFVILALWFSIVYVIINFYRISKPAAWLLVPYILWVSFAAYLNLAIWLLN